MHCRTAASRSSIHASSPGGSTTKGTKSTVSTRVSKARRARYSAALVVHVVWCGVV